MSTPSGSLSTVIQGDGRTDWVAEPLVKERGDLDVIAARMK